jgi:hypothetical protein
MAQTFKDIMEIEREPGQHVMATMNMSGDLKTVWNSENTAEIDAARAQFQSMKAKGYMAYRVNRKGDKGEVMDKFDPNAETIILAPPMQGGRCASDVRTRL